MLGDENGREAEKRADFGSFGKLRSRLHGERARENLKDLNDLNEGMPFRHPLCFFEGGRERRRAFLPSVFFRAFLDRKDFPAAFKRSRFCFFEGLWAVFFDFAPLFLQRVAL